MYLRILIVVIGFVLFGLLFYKQTRKTECRLWLDEKYPNIRPSFKEKLCKVLTSQPIADKLSKELPYIGNDGKPQTDLYSNRLDHLIDSTYIGLEIYLDNPNKETENGLYDQLETEFDKIFAN